MLLPGCPDATPDQIIWWVYNDKGNIHTETSGDPIGLQVNATAFAFKTNDDINNMTFYTYVLLNKVQIFWILHTLHNGRSRFGIRR